MSADSANTADDSASYSYRPSPMGAPRVYKLAGEGIEWATGRNDGRIAFRDIRRLRMSYKPSGMQSHRFITEIWADGAPKLKITVVRVARFRKIGQRRLCPAWAKCTNHSQSAR